MMDGRPLRERFPANRERKDPGGARSVVQGRTSWRPRAVRLPHGTAVHSPRTAGEIVGIAGSMGSGRSEFLAEIYGGYPSRDVHAGILSMPGVSAPVTALRDKRGLALFARTASRRAPRPPRQNDRLHARHCRTRAERFRHRRSSGDCARRYARTPPRCGSRPHEHRHRCADLSRWKPAEGRAAKCLMTKQRRVADEPTRG